VEETDFAGLEATVREVHDRSQIAQLVVTYAEGIDRRNWDLVRSCFTDDAEVEGSRTTAPIDSYLAELRPGVDYYPTTMHFMGNQLVDVDGDTGHIQTYAVAYHWKDEEAGKDHPENLIVGVRYRDTVERGASGWKITKRKVEPDWRNGRYPQV
jgi:3-phenylpropionate/cinnamic acid dioxygenase small subunit